MKNKFALMVAAAGLTGAAAFTYTNVSAQSVNAAGEQYLNQWLALQAAFDKANVDPGFKTRIRGRNVNAYQAYYTALQQGEALIQANLAAAARFSKAYGTGYAADTQGKNLLGRVYYTDFRRSHKLKAASYLLRETKARNQRLQNDKQYSKHRSLKMAESRFTDITHAGPDAAATYHRQGQALLDAALKILPQDAELLAAVAAGNKALHTRQQQLARYRYDKLITNAESLLTSLPKLSIDEAAGAHRQALTQLTEAQKTVPEAKQATALIKQWQPYMETRINQWQHHTTLKDEYVHHWRTLGELHHLSLTQEHGAVNIIQELQRNLAAPSNQFTEERLLTGYQQYIRGQESLDTLRESIATFTGNYGEDAATRQKEHKRLMVTERGFEDHSSFYSAFSDLGKASHLNPEALLATLSVVPEQYAAYPKKAVNKYLALAANLMQANELSDDVFEKRKLQATILVEAAMRFKVKHPELKGLQHLLGVPVPPSPAVPAAAKPDTAANPDATATPSAEADKE